jgi:hypothetical protein
MYDHINIQNIHVKKSPFQKKRLDARDLNYFQPHTIYLARLYFWPSLKNFFVSGHPFFEALAGRRKVYYVSWVGCWLTPPPSRPHFSLEQPEQLEQRNATGAARGNVPRRFCLRDSGLGQAPATCTCLMRIGRAGPRGGSCSHTSSGIATVEGRIRRAGESRESRRAPTQAQLEVHRWPVDIGDARQIPQGGDRAVVIGEGHAYRQPNRVRQADRDVGAVAHPRRPEPHRHISRSRDCREGCYSAGGASSLAGQATQAAAP